jgi:hypothetical protein
MFGSFLPSLRGLTALALAALAVVACAGYGGYAQVRHDADITRAFEAGNPPQAYRYYFLGWENRPNAILGLDRRYTLTSRFWKPVETADASLMQLAAATYDSPSTDPFGSRVVDAEGNVIGVLYTAALMASVKVNPETLEVSIRTDQPWVRDDGDGFMDRHGGAGPSVPGS